MKKRIGIDARLYAQTGVGTYIRNLIHYLDLDSSVNDMEIFLFVLPRDNSLVTLQNPHISKIDAPYSWHSMSEQIGFNRLLHAQNLDLMHFTYFSYPVLYHRPFIATVHDLTPLHFKTGRASTLHPLLYEAKYRAFSFILSQQVKNAAHLITPTQTVKNELIAKYTHLDKDKITPIYEGIDYELLQTEPNNALQNKYAFPFCIYVGNFYPHKNVENLIRAFADVKTDTKLVLVGPEDFFASRMRALIHETGQGERILFHHSADKSDLVFFYAHARALIHPSLSEGFGLPLVEAMHFGLPIIASDIRVFKEILADQYIAFDPQKTDEIKTAIERLLANLSEKTNYSPLYSKYSFQKMANRTLEIYLASK